MRGGDNAIAIDIKFPTGMEQLRLKTTDGGNDANSDHATWADAKFTE
ncbi:NPCBM/NEW2 domain protein [Novipirellula artificiosorum]|uniref:NPCBM/NEW2 domain protein n=2 Tax=Novipirellula artificiosorum TaxID=2528016 RepID=A0A5C6D5Y2_9BACT|nr:NPCBM/NEW2 domain protein [Novipirellula artificiosorum]